MQLANASSKLSVWADSSDPKSDPMTRLFNRLDGMYPQRWRAAFPSEVAIANWRDAWRDAFNSEGVTFEDVARGLKTCQTTFDWPPSLAEFLKACRVTVDPEAAFYEAVEQMRNRKQGAADKWTHSAIYWAAQAFGTWDLNNVGYDKAKTRWARILNEKLANPCEPVPKPALALPPPGDTTPDPERVAMLLKAARAAIKKVPAEA